MSSTEQETSVQLRDKAAEVGESAQRQAAEVKDQAMQKGGRELRMQVDERTTQAGQQARALARALRKSGTELQTQPTSAQAAKVTSGIAERLERAGSYLENVRGEDLLRDAEQFARRMPWVVAGASAVAGFVASRFLKASSENRYDQHYGGDRQYGRTPEPWRPVSSPSLESSQYADPPTVTVGSSGTAPAH